MSGPTPPHLPAPSAAPIPAVPQGTPGRDWRAGLPSALPPGDHQPWRRLGPGNRHWIVAITVVALVVVAVAVAVAVGLGTARSAFTATGVVVLETGQYSASETECQGEQNAAGVAGGVTITFSESTTSFEATLDDGRLVAGNCQLAFDYSTLDARADRTYSVAIGRVGGTPVSGEELVGARSVTVYVSAT